MTKNRMALMKTKSAQRAFNKHMSSRVRVVEEPKFAPNQHLFNNIKVVIVSDEKGRPFILSEDGWKPLRRST